MRGAVTFRPVQLRDEQFVCNLVCRKLFLHGFSGDDSVYLGPMLRLAIALFFVNTAALADVRVIDGDTIDLDGQRLGNKFLKLGDDVGSLSKESLQNIIKRHILGRFLVEECALLNC